MAAETFITDASGDTAQAAFTAARKKAQYDHGHAGYTGTIAEKDTFVLIPFPGGDAKTAHAFAEALLRSGDKRIDSKWGPAGCLDLGEGKYVFFGWASA